MRRVVLMLVFIVLSQGVFPSHSTIVTAEDFSFDGMNAMGYLVEQCNFGPRPPGSENLSQCRAYLAGILEDSGWNVTLQSFSYRETECVNIIANWNLGSAPQFILGAHYDTRPVADRDPAAENRSKSILGANDGASGVAVLLELARVLPEVSRAPIEIVLFDAEDSGNVNEWGWIVGSSHYVDQLSTTKASGLSGMILVDMVGDADLRLEREITSTDALQDAIWTLAAEMGHDDKFLDVTGGSILDDHTPFLEAQIPALNIIQHSPFPWYWHTLEDTPDKCSAESLEAVGSVLERFLLNLSDEIYPIEPFSSDFLLSLVLLIPILMVVALVVYKRRV